MWYQTRMRLTKVEGVVQNLERTSVTRESAGNTHTNTTHITLFKLGEDRVELRLSDPPPLSDGDRVRVAGYQKPGLLSAEACFNVSTGWTSPRYPLIFSLVGSMIPLLGGVMMAFFFPMIPFYVIPAI